MIADVLTLTFVKDHRHDSSIFNRPARPLICLTPFFRLPVALNRINQSGACVVFLVCVRELRYRSGGKIGRTGKQENLLETVHPVLFCWEKPVGWGQLFIYRLNETD